MDVPVIPQWFLSVLAILAGILCTWSAFRLRSLPPRIWAGFILIGPPLIGYGVIYYYSVTFVHQAEMRQFAVRLLLVYLFSVIVIWQVILNRRGK